MSSTGLSPFIRLSVIAIKGFFVLIPEFDKENIQKPCFATTITGGIKAFSL